MDTSGDWSLATSKFERVSPWLLAWLMLISVPIAAQSLNPGHLNEMPTIDRVKTVIQGSNPQDTAARQAAAFTQLRQVIYDLALSQRRDRNEVTPDEKRLADGYYAANYYVSQPIEKSLSEDEKRQWTKLQSHYVFDPNFREELLTQFFSTDFRTSYFKAMGAMDERAHRAQQGTQPSRHLPSWAEREESLRNRGIAGYIALLVFSLALVARSILASRKKSLPLDTLSGVVSRLSQEPNRKSLIVPGVEPRGNLAQGWMDLRIGEKPAFMKGCVEIDEGMAVTAVGIAGDRFEILALRRDDSGGAWAIAEPARPYTTVDLIVYLLCGVITFPVIVGMLVFWAITRKYRLVMPWINGLAAARAQIEHRHIDPKLDGINPFQ